MSVSVCYIADLTVTRKKLKFLFPHCSNFYNLNDTRKCIASTTFLLVGVPAYWSWVHVDAGKDVLQQRWV